ncbi:MAG: dihydrofolate reductase family protein [Anaerolineae bacterium]|nr:dihydrofolate reductase family protein [Anaerolineae bacterium]
MRKVIYSMSVSLDGFVEGPNKNLNWVIIDEEIHTFFNEQAREMGAFLYGRRIYELMADYWPTADLNPSAPAYEAEFARIWRDKPKIVFSQSLEKVEWNSRLVRGNLTEEVKKLKAQPGNDLSVGGPALAATLMELGLVDVFYLVVNPVTLGSGTHFFPAMRGKINLRLMGTRTFDSGVVMLHYQQSEK